MVAKSCTSWKRWLIIPLSRGFQLVSTILSVQDFASTASFWPNSPGAPTMLRRSRFCFSTSMAPRGSRSALAMQGSQVRSRPIWSWLKELRHFFGEGWLVVEVYLLLWKMMEWVKVSWDDDIPFPIWWESHNPFHGSSHHQAFIGDFNDFMRFLCWNCMGFFVDVSNWSKAEGETERITDTKY